MLIIKMIMKITKLNQEELANEIGVSRASINKWINSNEKMTSYEKNVISKKFDIPISYFTDDLLDNYDKSRELYLLIMSNWNNKQISYKSKIEITEDELLNKIENDINLEKDFKLSDYQIIDSLVNGCNPYTGKSFESDHILKDKNINNFMKRIRDNIVRKMQGCMNEDDLNQNEKELLYEFKNWRKKVATNKGCYEYMIFTNKELINIVVANVNNKDDIKKIKGIGIKKYNEYGDDIFYIKKFKNYRIE